MPNVGGTCEYVLDPDDPETWGGDEGDKCYVDEETLNEEGVWSCPHKVEEGEDLCIFHLPSKRKTGDKISEAILHSLKRAIEEEDSKKQMRYRQFIGANIPTLQVSNTPLRGSGKHPIDFRHASFESELILENLKIDSRINFRGATFNRAIFLGTEFCDWATFNGSKFHSFADFRRTRFKSASAFMGVNFDGGVTFQDAQFNEWVDFRQVVFRHEAVFWRSNFRDEADFSDTEFTQSAHFEDVEYMGNTKFIRGKLGERVSFEKVDLTEVDFSGANLQNTNLESSLLSRATLFNADVRGAKLSGAVLGDMRIDDSTKFLGRPTDDNGGSPHTLSTIRSKQCCVYDPDYEDNDGLEDIAKAKSVYRALEELGGKAARSRLQARCFVRRQDLQKKDYWDEATDSDSSLEERVIAGARWSRARMAELALLYGESPWRIIAYSLGTILVFGLAYPLGGWVRTTTGVQSPVTYTRIAQDPMLLWKSIYHSAMLFATGNRYGGVKAVNLTGEVLTTVEALLGPTLLALLVFVLGRRAAR